MIYTELTKKAMKLCFAAHKEQVDKSGLPYVFHPLHLAEQMTDEDSTVVALLHDIVEDTEYTLDNLRDMGFPQRILDAVALMTHDKSVPYMEYVRRSPRPHSKAGGSATQQRPDAAGRCDRCGFKARAKVSGGDPTVGTFRCQGANATRLAAFLLRDRYPSRPKILPEMRKAD